MKTIILPDIYNYTEAYLTLRCNLGCSYCINNNSGKVKRKRKELTAEQWAEGLNRINFNGVPLTLGGGEPTLHKDFYILLELLRPDMEIDLLSNLEFDIEDFIRKIDPQKFNSSKKPAYKSIRVSFHSEKMNGEELINKAKRMQNAGFNIGIFGLNHPLSVEDNMYMTELARKKRIFFFVKDFLGEYDGKLFGNFNYPKALDNNPKKAKCRTHELLIGPEGNIYKCHRHLYIGKGSVGNILDPDLEITDEFKECSDYGICNPCDVKLKTNRFLQMGNCSVEIIETGDD